MNTAVLHHLHELVLQCWEEVAVPQEMHYANTITLIRTRETAATVTASVEHDDPQALDTCTTVI